MISRREQLIDEYLRRFDNAAVFLPADRREELRQEIVEHIDAGLEEADAVHSAVVRSVLERLGPPADIVAAEVGGPRSTGSTPVVIPAIPPTAPPSTPPAPSAPPVPPAPPALDKAEGGSEGATGSFAAPHPLPSPSSPAATGSFPPPPTPSPLPSPTRRRTAVLIGAAAAVIAFGVLTLGVAASSGDAGTAPSHEAPVATATADEGPGGTPTDAPTEEGGEPTDAPSPSSLEPTSPPSPTSVEPTASPS
ncbi:HAAS signaling domain-containing protein [Streptomyces sp. NPDC055055]